MNDALKNAIFKAYLANNRKRSGLNEKIMQATGLTKQGLKSPTIQAYISCLKTN